MQKLYIIKNSGAWMMDELLVFSQQTTFDLYFLRKQPAFYQDKIDLLESNGVNVYYLSGWNEVSFKKIIFVLQFLVRNIHCFLNKHSLVYGLKSIIYFLKTEELLFREQHISIHSQFATQPTILAVMLKKYYSKKDIQVFFTFHAYDIFVKNRWFSFLAADSEKALSISHFNINYVCRQYKVNPGKIAYSPLGVYIPSEVPAINPSDTLQIGFMSFFVEMKGILYLMPAIKMLKEKGVSFKLHIAGDGTLKDYILDFIKQNNLDQQIVYHGLVKNSEKEQFFKNLHVFLLPSISKGMETDGLPVVLMEAVSYGIPIISTNVSGIPEICINDYNGYLIEQRNIDEIVSAIIKFKNNPEKWADFSKNSMEIAQQYNIVTNSTNKLKMMNWLS